ncbi:MAG: FecR domain-containing protein, partial [Armatimonadota bacterium]
PKQARVVAVQGKPLFSTADRTAWEDIRSGMRVSDGTRVRTARGEMVTIRWPDGSEVVMGAQTDATVLPESKPSGVVLDRGLIYARIRPQQLGFYVRGPQATATVIGTEFWLEARGNATSLFVIRGKVRFANAAGQVVVTRWKKSTAVAGRAPSPLKPTSPLDANSFWWLRHSQPGR